MILTTVMRLAYHRGVKRYLPAFVLLFAAVNPSHGMAQCENVLSPIAPIVNQMQKETGAVFQKLKSGQSPPVNSSADRTELTKIVSNEDRLIVPGERAGPFEV